MFRSCKSLQSLSCLILGLTSQAMAANESVLAPNQLTGVVEFSNSDLVTPNPQVAQVLQQHPFSGQSYLYALGETRRLRAEQYLFLNADNSGRLTYSLTVSTNEVGERYNAYVRAMITNGSRQ